MTTAARLELRPPPLTRTAFLAAAIATLLGLAAALDARAAALIVAALVAPVLIWADPRVGFVLFALTLGINLDVVTAPVFVSLPELVALTLVAAVATRATPGVERTGLWSAGGWIFVAAALPSLVRSISAADAFAGMLKLGVIALLLGAGVRFLIRRPGACDPILSGLVAGAVISLVPAVAQVILDVGPATYRVGGVMRAYSTYGQPNSYGLYLAGVLPVAVALAFARRSWRQLLAALGIAVALLLTGSRGAWVGALAGLLALLVVTARLRARTIVAALIGATALAGIALLAPRGLIIGRFDLSDWSAQQRLLVLLTAWDGIGRSPILGWGPGSFQHMLPDIARRGLTDDVVMPHNVLLDIWFELGLLALLCFIALTIACVIASARSARQTRDLRVAGLLAGVVAMLAAAMFGSLFIRGVQETFVLLVALTAALVRARRHQTDSADAHPVPV